MGWFDSRKKYTLPPFAVNAFGKLPFYKEYLYICPDQAFADLKSWVDDRFERLSRQGTEPPYLAPDRHFLIYMPQHKADLVGSIWESDDGLRTFPFMLAAVIPRKARKYGFPLFWQCLNQVWEYFERYGTHLRETGSSTDFYKGLRGVEHQLPKIIEPEWPALKKRDVEGRKRLGDGAFAKYHFGKETSTLEQWFANLDLPDLPNLILWPQSNHNEVPYEAVGYVSMMGMEALALDLFLPVPELGEKPAPKPAPTPGVGLAAELDARFQDADISEDATLVLGPKGEPSPDSTVKSPNPGGEQGWDQTQELDLSSKQRALMEDQAGEEEPEEQDVPTVPFDLQDVAAMDADDAEFTSTQPLPKMEPPSAEELGSVGEKSADDSEEEELPFTQYSISMDQEGLNLLEALVDTEERHADSTSSTPENADAPPAGRRSKDSD